MLAVALALLSSAVVLPACGRRNETAAQELRAAMRRTTGAPRALVYDVDEGGSRSIVRAAVHDDLRYKASLSIEETAAYEEVAVDDALAVRVLDPRALEVLRRPGAALAPELSSALSSGNGWAVDPGGAPSLLASAATKRRVGADPVLDALSAFRQVDKAMVEAGGAHRFNPDSLDYRPQDDPLPRPRAGVIRYDLERPRLPRPEDAVGGGARAIPGPANFRRLSVYVKDGFVVQVLEVTDVTTRLRDLRRLYDLGIPASGPTDEVVPAVVARLNQLRGLVGAEPIRLRSMSLRLVDVGVDPPVELPGGAIPVDLGYFRDRGASANVAKAATP
jgi:hypothetical protein